MRQIYLDNAATTPLDKNVLEAMLPFLKESFGNASSLHRLGIEARNTIEKSREIIAKKINAEPEEIIFTSGGTESDNLAIKGIAREYSFKGKHIIASKVEHPAVLESCKFLEEEEFEITYLDVDKEGLVDFEQLRKSIRKDTILVSIMQANNEIGTIQDIGKIGKLCKSRDVFFHSDCVQSFAKVLIDVKKMNVSLASLSSHKIHGPKGVGALFVSKELRLIKILHGGRQEFDYRAGTENVAGIVGFAKAVELMDYEDSERMMKVRDLLMRRILDEIPDSFLNGPRGNNRLCNNLNFSFKYVSGEALMMDLDTRGIQVSTGSACSLQSKEPSHVLTAIGLKDDLARSSIRMTLNKYLISNDEVEYVVNCIKEIVGNLRNVNPSI